MRPKPPGSASGLRHEELQLTLETALSLQKAGYFFTQQGRVYSSEGDMTVENNNGLIYSLRFGEVAAGDSKPGAPTDNRTLFVMVHFDPAKAAAYGEYEHGRAYRAGVDDASRLVLRLISGKDFQNLRAGTRGDCTCRSARGYAARESSRDAHGSATIGAGWRPERPPQPGWLPHFTFSVRAHSRGKVRG